MITAVVLAPALDISYDVDHLVVGQIHRPKAVTRCAGGKGLNMVRAASRMGAPVHAVPVLGGPVGVLLAALLVEEGLPATVVRNTEETRICVSVAGEEMTEIYQRGTPLGAGVLTEVGQVLDDVVEPGWLVLNGGLPAGTDPAEVAAVLTRHRERGVRLAVDCYGPVLPLLLEGGVDLVKINRVEAADLLGVDAATADLGELTTAVADRAGAPVVVTDGARGSMLHDGTGCWLVAASARRGQHSVGSGDSYLGGLLAGLEAGLGLGEAVRLAAGTATANAQVPGPGVLDPGVARAAAAELEITALG
ncbi:1-phosphofructokinase family hexose kinase [Desertihabitans aurantiacus]|uniref:1-phosphofructokinase family hexose kinase n=1 Tax=Desertihabitans aurantiacus TaxID=2282477 RepID=UPI000DF742DB|nr:PfkB family carbohydrate kinase [Desertihabitans aurantiacus]